MDDVREWPSSPLEQDDLSSDERRERHCERCERGSAGVVLPGGRRVCEPCARRRATGGGLYCWAGPGDGGGRPPDVR